MFPFSKGVVVSTSLVTPRELVATQWTILGKNLWVIGRDREPSGWGSRPRPKERHMEHKGRIKHENMELFLHLAGCGWTEKKKSDAKSLPLAKEKKLPTLRGKRLSKNGLLNNEEENQKRLPRGRETKHLEQNHPNAS